MARARQDRSQAVYPPDVFQQAAIEARGSALRIVAPAGSGKTETLVRRVIQRITQDGVDPKRILMLTFDNNGQRSFEQVWRRFASSRDMPEFLTLNKFGKSLLDTHFAKPRFVTTEDKEIQKQLSEFLREVTPTLGILSWDEQRRTALDAFAALKNHAIVPEEKFRQNAIGFLRTTYLELPVRGEALDLFADRGVAVEGDPDAPLHRIFDAYLRYEQEMTARRLMDMQDQKLRPFRLLMQKANRDVRDQLQQRYDEVIVDEAQDLSQLDALFIWQIIGPETIITLAGDDDQTIYEFRQASSVFLREAPTAFGRPFETFQLNINYRSPEAILDPAQKLIAHNIERLEKPVTASRSDLGEVRVIPATTPQDRYRQVAEAIRELVVTERFDWDDIAILTPQRNELAAITAAMVRANVPTKVASKRRDQQRGVELATFHGAKGRQWPVVVLPMSGEGEMPRLRNVQQGELEAERRLFYVSMSRAEDVLILAYVQREEGIDGIHRSAAGEITGTTGASRFLFEAGLVSETLATDEQDDEVVVPTAVPEPATIVAETTPASVPETAPAIAPVPSVEPPVVPIRAKETKAERAVRRKAEREAVRGGGLPADMLHLMERAEKQLEIGEYGYAAIEAWKVYERILRVLVPEPGTSYARLKTLEYSDRLPRQLIDRLHIYRRVRNQYAHEDEDGTTMPETQRQQAAESMVRQLRQVSAVAMNVVTPAAPPVTTPVAPPTPEVIETPATAATPSAPTTKRTLYPLPTDRVLHVLQVLARGGYDPERKKVIRKISFHVRNQGVEFLPLQLGLILQDQKFFMPKRYRFTESAIFAQFCADRCGSQLPAGIVSRPVPEAQRPFLPRIHELMGEVLDAYLTRSSYDGDERALLARRLEDALVLNNGSATSGVIFEELPEDAAPGWARH